MLYVIKHSRVMLFPKHNLCTTETWPFSNLMLQSVEEIYKVASISLSPNVPAQIFVSNDFCSFPRKFILPKRKSYCVIELAINFFRRLEFYLIFMLPKSCCQFILFNRKPVLTRNVCILSRFNS